MPKIPIIMCIDVEPDERLISPNLQSQWSGFESTYEFFSLLRHRLEEATGSPAHFTWFFRMDPQIEKTYGTAAWVVRRYAPFVERIRRAGDALGLHIHSWRWDEHLSKWIVELADQRWIDHCVRLGFESFRTSLNQPCQYFRFGDHWMNNATLALVEKLGARFDLTLEPGQLGSEMREVFTGSFLDYSQVPQYPYRPSKADFRKPGLFLRRKLWVVPLTAGGTDWLPNSNEVNSSTEDHTNHQDVRLGGYPNAIKNLVNGAYEGYLDRADCELISGWAYDKNHPDKALEVEVYDDNALLTSATAATFREDLLSAGKGNGRHCFNVVVPTFLKDGKPHVIRVKVADSTYFLNNSPLKLTCSGGDHQAGYMTLNLSFNPWTLCRIIDRALCNFKEPYLAMVVRSDALIHADEHSNVEQIFNYILSHRLIREMAFETPSEMLKRKN